MDNQPCALAFAALPAPGLPGKAPTLLAFVRSAPVNEAARRSRAAVPESAVHDALSVIDGGGAVAFDLTRPAEHYFRPSGASVEERLLEGLTELDPGAPAALEQALASTPLLFRLRDAFLLLQALAEPRLRERRFVIVHQGHVLFEAGLILDHAGTQAHTGRGPGRPTIYLPLPLLTLVHDQPALRPQLLHLLAHADFHLRGDPEAVIIDDHPFSSAPEHAHIEQLWQAHRHALRVACRPALQLQDAHGAAYFATVLYLLGGGELVMADTVPLVLPTLASTGSALVELLPQVHAAFLQALADAPAGTCFKLAVVAAGGRSLAALLGDHGVQLPAEVRAALDERPLGGVVAIRRTPAPDDLARLDAACAGLDDLAGAAALLARCPDADDLHRAVLHAAHTPERPALQVADDFLLSRAETAVLIKLLERVKEPGVARGRVT
jgi:hypothetical protein